MEKKEKNLGYAQVGLIGMVTQVATSNPANPKLTETHLRIGMGNDSYYIYPVTPTNNMGEMLRVYGGKMVQVTISHQGVLALQLVQIGTL